MAPSTRSPYDTMLLPRSIGNNLEQNACIEVIVPLVATLVIIVRLWLRRVSKLALRVDDYLIMFSLLFLWGNWGTWVYTSRNIVGNQVSKMDVTELEPFIKACFALEFFYAQGLNVVKFAVLFFYLRALGTTKSARIQIYVLMGIVGAYTLTRLLGTFFECVPFSYFWNRSQEGSCVSARPFLISLQALNWATELLILLFPIPIVMRLNLPYKRKLGIVVVFSMGGLTLCASAVRLYYIQKIFNGQATALLKDDAVPKLEVCNLTEFCLAIITATLPAIRTPAARAARNGVNRIRTRTQSRPSPGNIFPGAIKKLSQATTTCTTEVSEPRDNRFGSVDSTTFNKNRDSIHVSKEITVEEVTLGPRPIKALFLDDFSMSSTSRDVSPISQITTISSDELSTNAGRLPS